MQHMCLTVQLGMLQPVADGDDGFLFITVSNEIVACINMDDSSLGEELPAAINPFVNLKLKSKSPEITIFVSASALPTDIGSQ